MSKSRKWMAAACAAAVSAPAGIALAADHQPAAFASRAALRAPLGSHRSVAGQMRAFGAERRRRRARAMAQVPTVLQQIAQCESHGDPHAVGGGGAYRGAFQFSRSTWAAVGGHGDPAQAPLAEQYRRAAILLERSGTGQWPVCGA